MDRYIDQQRYLDLDRQAWFQNPSIEKRKLVHSRILKLSALKADISCEMIGRALYFSGELQKSLIPLKKATIINPRNTSAQICLASSFLKLGRGNECFFTLQKAISISPTELALHSLVIKLLKDGNQLRDLPCFYQETASMIKNEFKIFEMYFASGEILENLGMLTQALEQYRKVSEGDGINYMRYEHFFRYANVLAREGFLREAIYYFGHARAYYETSPIIINNVASLYYELGEVDQAFGGIVSLFRVGKQTSMTYLNLILVLEDLDKDEKEAKEYRDRIQDYIQGNREEMRQQYETELTRTEEKLKSNMNEKMREFYIKKLKGLNRMASLLNN